MMPGKLSAQWDKFPLTDNYPDGVAYETVRSECDPLQQIFNAIQERLFIINNTNQLGTVVISTNIWEFQYRVSAGSNQNLVVDGDRTWTNWSYETKLVTVTNTLGLFDYEYTDFSGDHTAQAWAYPTRAHVTILRDVTAQIVGYFLSDQKGIGSTLGTYISSRQGMTNNITQLLPNENIPNIFARNNLDVIASSTTNRWGWTNSGSVYYYTHDLSSFGKVLLEASYNTNGLWRDTKNGWQLNQMDAETYTGIKKLYPHYIGGYFSYENYYWYSWFEDVPELLTFERSFEGGRLAELYKPVLQYRGTNAAGVSSSATITGSYITNVNLYSGVTGTETLSVGQQSSNTWIKVWNLEPNPAGVLSTNDAFVLLYTNDTMRMYDDQSYTMNREELDTIYAMLLPLKYSVYNRTDFGNTYGAASFPNVGHCWLGKKLKSSFGEDFIDSTWTGVKALATAWVNDSANYYILTNRTESFNYPYFESNHGLFDDAPVSYNISVSTVIDSKNCLTNVCPVGFDAYYYNRPDGFDTNFIDYAGISPLQGKFYYREKISVTAGVNHARSTISYLGDMINVLPDPSGWQDGVSYGRGQRFLHWFWIIDWSPYLKYK